MDLTIDVRREDGVITRLEGVAGLAMIMPSDVMPIVDGSNLQEVAESLPDMPVISSRVDNSHQLAVLLGMLISFVESISPEAVDLAIQYAMITNCTNPDLRVEHPK